VQYLPQRARRGRFRDAILAMKTNEFAQRRHAKRCAFPGYGHTRNRLATWAESVEDFLIIFLKTGG